MALKHMAYQLPQIGGESQKWKVQPMYFDPFFKECGLLTIPVFQRTYCWTDDQIAGWWRDLRLAKEEAGIASGHRVGKIMFKEIIHPLNSDGGSSKVGSALPKAMSIIDGQQRITTTLLFLAAIRDALLISFDLQTDPRAAALCAQLEEVLYVDPKAFQAWLASQRRLLEDVPPSSSSLQDDPSSSDFPLGLFQVGQPLWFSRLVPSYLDRLPFFELITAGPLRRPSPSATTLTSVQWRAKSYFDREIRAWLDSRPAESILRDLGFLASRQLGFFSLMYMESLNDMSFLPQLFLWLQEKSLFSMGALLWNPSPGVHFRAIDLVRNLLIAPFAGLPCMELERLYFTRWIEPLESRIARPEQMDQFLMAFLVHRATKADGSPVRSYFETTMLAGARASGFPIDIEKCRGVIIYGRIHAIFESLQSIPDPAGHLLDELATFMDSWNPNDPIPNLDISI